MILRALQAWHYILATRRAAVGATGSVDCCVALGLRVVCLFQVLHRYRNADVERATIHWWETVKLAKNTMFSPENYAHTITRFRDVVSEYLDPSLYRKKEDASKLGHGKLSYRAVARCIDNLAAGASSDDNNFESLELHIDGPVHVDKNKYAPQENTNKTSHDDHVRLLLKGREKEREHARSHACVCACAESNEYEWRRKGQASCSVQNSGDIRLFP